MDWNYSETQRNTVDSIAKRVLSKGFKVIGCPAVNWCRWGPRVGALQFENINAYAETYCNLNDPGNLGIIISNWVPQRYIQNAQWDTYSIAADILKNKGKYDYMNTLPGFVKSHFNVKWDAGWEKIYHVVYQKTPQSFCAQNRNSRFISWSTDKDIRNILRKNQLSENPFNDIKKVLLDYAPHITKNKKDYNDFLFTFEFIEYNFDRQNNLLNFANSQKFDEKSVNTFISKVASNDSIFLSKLDNAWQPGRRSKVDEIRKGKDYMMSFYAVCDFTKKLRENPSELIRILKDK
jgi:hypothetical protein